MIPILFCFPIFGSNPGYVCCLPTHILLNILSTILLLILFPVLTLNIFDPGEINSGFWAMHLFIFGTLLFITFGVIGIRRFSQGFISASLMVWLITYTGFLMFAVYSVWNPQTMERSSINGRCAMNLWLFDWCCKAHSIQCKTGQPTGLDLSTLLQDSIYFSKDLFNDNENVNEKLLEKYELPNRFDIKRLNNNVINLTDFMESKIYATNSTAFASSKTKNSNKNEINQENVYNEYRNFNSQVPGNHQNELKRDFLEVMGYKEGSEYRVSVAALFGTIGIMLSIISLYTLYAVALNDILTVLRYPFPIVFIAGMPPGAQEGEATGTEQRSPEIVLR